MFLDGNAWCATLDGFVNLQESVAGFGDTPRAAVANLLENVKEHATLSARAHFDHGVEVGTKEEHVNRAADRGCCVSTCCASDSIGVGYLN